MRKIVIRIFLLLLPSLLTASDSFSQQKSKPPVPPAYADRKLDSNHNVMRAPTGVGFFIDAIGEDQATFSLLLSDENNRTVAGTFRRAQVEIFEALMIEAKKFAETAEDAGVAGNPKTTRFMDKDEKSLIVDVQKTGLESRFFITLQTLQGTLTVDTGAIRRGNKKDSPLFFAALARLQAAKDGAQSPK